MRTNATKFFVRNSYIARAGKGGAQGIYRTLAFVERWNQYPAGNVGASAAGRWAPYQLATSAAPLDNGSVKVGGTVTAAGFTVGDGVGVNYTMSGGAGQLTRTSYLIANDVSGARWDMRQRWTLSAQITNLDQTFPVIESGVEIFVPTADFSANKSGVRFLIGYDAGGYYARIVDAVNGGGELTKLPLGLAWIPYATLIALNLSCDGANITFTCGPASNLVGILGVGTFARTGTVGVHHNWNSGAVDKAAGLSNLRINGTTF